MGPLAQGGVTCIATLPRIVILVSLLVIELVSSSVITRTHNHRSDPRFTLVQKTSWVRICNNFQEMNCGSVAVVEVQHIVSCVASAQFERRVKESLIVWHLVEESVCKYCTQTFWFWRTWAQEVGWQENFFVFLSPSFIKTYTKTVWLCLLSFPAFLHYHPKEEIKLA